MTRGIGIVLCLMCAALAPAGCGSPYRTAEKDGWNHYGAFPKVGGDVVALGAVKGDETDIIVEGKVVNMCRTSGCWIMLEDERGDQLFVQFEDEGFQLPTNAIGHRAVAHGKGHVRVIPVEQRRHFAEVSGASKEEIAKITEPEHTTMLLADSVYIDGDDLAPAMTEEEAEAACEAAHGGEQ